MMRNACSYALLAAAAVAVSGCTPKPASTTLAANEAMIDLDTDPCSVSNKRLVIDYPPSSGPDQAVFHRKSIFKNAKFKPGKDEKDPDLFPKLKDQSFALLDKTKHSGVPTHEPRWTGDYDGDDEAYTFCYVVSRNGKECDPEICIRKSGNGCGGVAQADVDRCKPPKP